MKSSARCGNGEDVMREKEGVAGREPPHHDVWGLINGKGNKM